MWPKTLSAMCACWWQGTTADRWDSWNGSFNVLRKVSTVVLNSHALRAQVPTKVCKKEEVPLCTKQEVAETKKVKHKSDFLQLHSFRPFKELNWGVTDSLSLSLRYFTKVALLFSKGVQSRSNWGVPRHWGDMHTTIMWLQCESKLFRKISDIKRHHGAKYLFLITSIRMYFGCMIDLILLQVPAVCEDVCVPQFMCKICNQA